MWIVRLALRRPYTVGVGAALILIMGLLAVASMMVDIFPVIDIPVVGIVWSYPGLSAEDMERRVVLITERAMSTTVGGISRIESQSIPGMGLLQVYFEDGSDIGGAIAQISAVTGTVLRSLPPGMTAPNIVRFNASNVPVAQLTISSDTLTEEKLFDYALNFIRVKLFTIPGLSTPAPYGGKQRQINVDADPAALTARGLSPQDVVNALQAQNLILPAGVAHIGKDEFNVAINSSPRHVEDFNTVPLRVLHGATISLGDVAKISDSYAVQTNVVRINGKRASYLNLLKKANASTIAVVDAARRAIPDILASAPPGLNLKLDFDQSLFVSAAIKSVLREALISGGLVSLMILIFLGSWRSVIIVCTSIPLAILCSIIGLKLTGNSINLMTLGGLSLAIGMLVDDATVEVENIHRNRQMESKSLTAAILHAASQIALPAITATLAICIVFFPVVLLTGPARFLFTPMALSVVFAMMASYLLSRTLVPLLARMLMEKEPVEPARPEEPLPKWSSDERLHIDPPHTLLLSRKSAVELAQALDQLVDVTPQLSLPLPPPAPLALPEAPPPAPTPSRFATLNRWREQAFDRLQHRYVTILQAALEHPKLTLALFGILIASALPLPFLVGTDFFPQTDTGIMKLHFRAPPGMRLEETEKVIAQVEDHIRQIIPKDELETINSDIGVPTSYNLAFVPTENTASMDTEMLISLHEKHHPTPEYVRSIRKDLADAFPGCAVNFQPADIVSQVLNFGMTAPLDVQIEFPDFGKSYPVARQLRDKMRLIPGTADVNIRQSPDYPTLSLNVDRVVAANLGLTQKDVANAMVVSLSSSALTAPSYFLNPQNNVNYQVNVQVPLPKLRTVDDLLDMPVSTGTAPSTSPLQSSEDPTAQVQSLGNLATVKPAAMMNEVSHASVQRVLDVTANVEGRDLGGVARDINKAMKSLGQLPSGMKIKVRGQNEVMTESFTKLGLGLIVAIMLVYLLMAVLFQSWIDPFIVMMAVPGALVGILWMLLITGTSLNVTSFMGSIMAVGIAASNAILMVSFANDVRTERDDRRHPRDAAYEAGKTRLRPVLMTAIAMTLGMLPAALSLGEGGEQNAPLGRAVIGGLFVATIVTLVVVPVIYSLLRKKMPIKHLLDAKVKAEEEGRPFDTNALQGAPS